MRLFPLIQAEDIQRDALDGLPIRVNDNTSAVEQAIDDLSGILEDFLNRTLTVRKTVQVIPYTRWEFVYGFNYAQAYLTHYPLAEIIQVLDGDGEDVTSEYSIHNVTENREMMIRGPSSFRQIELTAYTGYRRKDQAIEHLRAADTSLQDLNELPLILPSEIRSVLTEIVINRLTLASSGQLGSGQKVTSIGNQDVTLSSPDDMFIHDRLLQLRNYQRVH